MSPLIRTLPNWRWLPALGSPVFIIGGWSLAAAVQPGHFDAVSSTISSLAARGTPHRWVMTAGLAGTGLCYLATAAGLTGARRPGRAVLAAGGVATALVAVFPLPHAGSSTAHTTVASVAFGCLAVWPALAARRDAVGPALRPVVAGVATAVLLGLVGWFTAELNTDHTGLAERVAAGAEALWPLAVVAMTSLRSKRLPPEWP